jgi:hypothetical protein
MFVQDDSDMASFPSRHQRSQTKGGALTCAPAQARECLPRKHFQHAPCGARFGALSVVEISRFVLDSDEATRIGFGLLVQFDMASFHRLDLYACAPRSASQ